MSDRVLVTGLGVVSPVGVGLDAFWDGLLNAESVPAVNEALPEGSMPIRHTYSVAEEERRSGEAAFGGTASTFAVRAARMALEDAGLGGAAVPSTIGISLGNAMGDDVFETERAGGKSVEGKDGFFFGVSAALANTLRLAGPTLSVSTACSAGLYSISMAVDMIRSGEVDAMLVGGSEAVCRVAMGCFNRLAAIDPVACRPFDAERKGTVMGEGAAVLLIESEAHFSARGGDKVYGRIAGAGWSCDGHHATIPEPSGRFAVRAARLALEESGLSPDDIGCVLVHGTGTQQNDAMEAAMIAELFRDRAKDLWVCGIKGKLGHQGGAAGAFQALVAALILNRGVIPPTGNTATLDEGCDVRLSNGDAAEVNAVLMNSYAFGGNNISLILERAR